MTADEPEAARQDAASCPDLPVDGVTEHSTSAGLMRVVAWPTFATWGKLVLHEGRLSFTAGRDTMVDIPVDELHSVAESPGNRGLYVWHGRRRYRFTFNRIGRRRVDGDDLLGALTMLLQAADDVGTSRAAKRRNVEWVEVLGPLVGAAPRGVRVRRPWPMWAWWVTIFGSLPAAIGVAMAAITVF